LIKFFFSLFSLAFAANSNATFSIIAVDTETKEFGSAFASCLLNVDLLPEEVNDLIEKQIVVYVKKEGNGQGIMNLQGALISGFALHEKATELISNKVMGKKIIQQLKNFENQLENQKEMREKYKIEDGFKNGFETRQILAITLNPNNNLFDKAVHTGKNTLSSSLGKAKQTQDGRYIYVIAGNILTDNRVLSALGEGFEKSSGSLSNKLIAALQNVRNNKNIGDKRCIESHQISSNISFLRLYKNEKVINNYTIFSKYMDKKDSIDELIAKYNHE
jgi:uncharacterized Ntn-hydrolase superfamily protein